MRKKKQAGDRPDFCIRRRVDEHVFETLFHTDCPIGLKGLLAIALDRS